MPSPRATSILRWATVAVLGSATVTSRAAAAAPEGHVYLDAESGHFAAPLRQQAGRTIPLYTRAAPDARLVLAYWPLERNESCPEGAAKPLSDAQLSRATLRAFAPAGPTDDEDTSYYTTKLGPLLYGIDYCFHLSGLVPHTIAPAERAQIGTALRQAIEGAHARRLDQDLPVACRPLGTRAQQLCELRDAFAESLPRRLARLKVVGGGGEEPMPLPDALEHVLREDRTMLQALSDGLAVSATEQEAAERLARLRTELLEPSAPLEFDPLGELSRDDLVAFASSDAAKAALTAAGDDPDDLLETLFSDDVYDDFVDRRPWEGNAADRAAREQLRDVFLFADGKQRGRDEPPPRVVVDRDYRNAIARAVRPDALEPTRDLQPFVDELGQLPEAAGYASSAARVELDAFRRTVDLARISAEVMVDQRRAFLANFAPRDGQPSPFVESLMEQLSAVRSLGTKAAFAFQPDYVQRFPLYASGDVGVAVGVIPVRGQRPRPDIAAYFGLNLYFAPVDKDEPLNRSDVRRPGRNLLRRISAVGGISFVNPRLNADDLGTDGVLLRQVALTGVGVRATDYLRFGAGAMFYTQRSANPLSDRRYLKAAPYVSISIDVDVIGTIRGWRDQARGGDANPSP